MSSTLNPPSTIETAPLLDSQTEAAIHALATAVGIAQSYTDYFDETQTPKTQWLVKVLEAMGFDLTDPKAAHAQFNLKQYQQGLSKVSVQKLSQIHQYGLVLTLYWPKSTQAQFSKIEIILEDNTVINIAPSDIKLTPTAFKNSDFTQYQLTVSKTALSKLSFGYHQLNLLAHDNTQKHTQLIITPDECYEPDWLKAGAKIWGPVVQLYAVRDENDWGLGDLHTLQKLVQQVAKNGHAGFVGISPLHAKNLCHPESASPYMPLSRQFYNALFIAVPKVSGYQKWFDGLLPECQVELEEKIEALRRLPMVNYPEVTKLKLGVLEKLFDQFYEEEIQNNLGQAEAFKNYCEQAGVALKQFALFQALQTHFGGEGWWYWPNEYHNPNSPECQQFETDHAKTILFYCYLQWVFTQQFEEAGLDEDSKKPLLRLGLYPDLAIGVEGAGFESWLYPGLYPKGVSQGLPPGLTTPKGQNWGFAPFSPFVLQEHAYAPFIKVIQANMQGAGALRIDHMFGLKRAFWLPEGSEASDALYVEHPFDDLMGILALESVRNECVLIAEDLGLPPVGYEEAVEPWKVFSYNMIHYANKKLMAKATPSNQYKPESLTVFSNHDKQTLKGMFTGWYPRTQEALKIIDREKRDQMMAIRERATMESIINQMQIEGCLMTHPHWSAQEWFDRILEELLSEQQGGPVFNEFNWAIHSFLAKSSAKLVGVQLEDLLGQEPQVNMPGTADADTIDTESEIKRFTNWRLKLPLPIEAYEEQKVYQVIMGMLSNTRKP